MPGQKAALKSGTQLKKEVVSVARGLGLTAREEVKLDDGCGAPFEVSMWWWAIQKPQRLSGSNAKHSRLGDRPRRRFQRRFKISVPGLFPVLSYSRALGFLRICGPPSIRPGALSRLKTSNRTWSSSLASLPQNNPQIGRSSCSTHHQTPSVRVSSSMPIATVGASLTTTVAALLATRSSAE